MERTHSTHPPITSWAVFSLACGILGWGGVVLVLVMQPWQGFAGTAGVGAGVAFLIGCAAGVLCLLAVLFGIVALGKIRQEHFSGRGQAWIGIVLGSLPLPVALLVGGSLLGWWPDVFVG